MRSILFAALLPASSLFAQEPAPQTPPTAPPPAVPPAAPAADRDISGSVSGQAGSATVPSRPAAESVAKAAQYPMQYLRLVAEAMKSFKARDFKATIAYADKADAIVPPGPTVWTVNVRGAVAIELRNFDEGRKLSEDALKLDPTFLPARFNLCEIPFLQGKYSDARRGWLDIYNATPKEDPTTELLTYRIFLTYLLEKDQLRAKEWIDKIPFPSQTPAYQYAHAALEHEAGNLEKWKGWLESAEFIWPEVKRADFLDVLVQLKWIPGKK